MWVGSKHRDTREKRKRDGEKKGSPAFWEHLAMVQSSVRRIVEGWGAMEAERREREGKGRRLEIALRVFP